MAFPDSNWTLGGELIRKSISPKQVKLCWDIYDDVKWMGENEEDTLKLKSDDFSFAGATWNFFASFDVDESHSQFGIVRTQSSDEAFYCNCDISFVTARNPLECIKNDKCSFIFQGAQSQWVIDFLTSCELKKFLEYGVIECLISMKNIEEASSQTEDTYFNQSSYMETLTQHPENENKDIPVGNIDCKVCQDFKNLLLSGEGSDVTLQVQDQEFKAHRSVITARSPVFASMFRHDMKEKATGVVNVEDCEPSSFPVLLEFLYCGSTEKLSIENVFSLYTSADKYDIQDLKMKCTEFIQKNISVETFCDTAKLSLQHSDTNLLKLTTDFFTRNLKKIILTVKWQTFITENPIQSNEFFIKALVSDVKDD